MKNVIVETLATISTLYGTKPDKNDDLYDALMPLFICTKALGLTSYTLVKKVEERKYKHSPIGVCYSVVFLFAFVAYYAYAIAERNRASYVQTHEITNAIDTFQLYSGIIVMAISILMNCYNEALLLKALKKFVKIDQRLKHVGIKVPYKKTKLIITGYCTILIIVYGFLEYYHCSMFLRAVNPITIFTKFCFAMCYLPLLVTNFIQCQFTCLVMIVRERFVLINKELRGMSDKRIQNNQGYQSNKIFTNKIHPKEPKEDQTSKEEETHKPIQKTLSTLTFLRDIHCKLCSISRLINQVYSLQMLLIIGNTFVSFTSLAYYCFESFSNWYLSGEFESYHTLTTLYWTASKMIQIAALSIICTITINEANKTGHMIYKIEQRFDPVFAKQIDFFGKQILHWKVKFSAFGFFDLDMNLLYSVICSATTYLIILVQLDAGSETKPTKSTIH